MQSRSRHSVRYTYAPRPRLLRRARRASGRHRPADRGRARGVVQRRWAAPEVRHPQLRPAAGRRDVHGGRGGAGPSGRLQRTVRPRRARPRRGRWRLDGLGGVGEQHGGRGGPARPLRRGGPSDPSGRLRPAVAPDRRPRHDGRLAAAVLRALGVRSPAAPLGRRARPADRRAGDRRLPGAGRALAGRADPPPARGGRGALAARGRPGRPRAGRGHADDPARGGADRLRGRGRSTERAGRAGADGVRPRASRRPPVSRPGELLRAGRPARPAVPGSTIPANGAGRVSRPGAGRRPRRARRSR